MTFITPTFVNDSPTDIMARFAEPKIPANYRKNHAPKWFLDAQDKEPLKTWKYGSFNVSRFQCVCGKKFNLYTSPKKEFTIPKPR